jgi:hypothetical protein
MLRADSAAAAALDSTWNDLQEIITSILLRSGMDMAESPVVSALANKGAEIAGIAGDPMIFWPDVAAEPPAIDLNDPAQTGCRDGRGQSASQLVQQNERRLRMQPETAKQRLN